MLLNACAMTRVTRCEAFDGRMPAGEGTSAARRCYQRRSRCGPSCCTCLHRAFHGVDCFTQQPHAGHQQAVHRVAGLLPFEQGVTDALDGGQNLHTLDGYGAPPVASATIWRGGFFSAEEIIARAVYLPVESNSPSAGLRGTTARHKTLQRVRSWLCRRSVGAMGHARACPHGALSAASDRRILRLPSICL